ncbi:MAG TPA: C40 family peptidase [Mycobacteriales bacterium]|nr:C40 family peptidase [Mycobacteriales bacterium]
MTGRVPTRSRRLRLLAAGLVLATAAVGVLEPAHATSPRRSRQAAALDDADLRLAAAAVEAQALSSGALRRPIHRSSPAAMLLASDVALITKARSADHRLAPVDTRPVMGPVPFHLAHLERHRPSHFAITATHTLQRFTHSVAVGGSAGVGIETRFRGVTPAKFRKPDAGYVDPRLPSLHRPTVGEVALRAALKELGQPYVWGGAGPTTFDCSGLVMRSYARAGVRLTHFSGDQWNEGRLIPARDALPGDLILFGHPIFHVAIYLGAGWMLNAPFTGHYVDVLPVWSGVAGVVRP